MPETTTKPKKSTFRLVSWISMQGKAAYAASAAEGAILRSLKTLAWMSGQIAGMLQPTYPSLLPASKYHRHITLRKMCETSMAVVEGSRDVLLQPHYRHHLVCGSLDTPRCQ